MFQPLGLGFSSQREGLGGFGGGVVWTPFLETWGEGGGRYCLPRFLSLCLPSEPAVTTAAAGQVLPGDINTTSRNCE